MIAYFMCLYQVAYFVTFSILALRIFPYSESFHFQPYMSTYFTRRMPRQGGHALSRAYDNILMANIAANRGA